jgi:hypothetical protein
MAEHKAKIPEDDFVSKVVKDPRQPPDTLLLSGYLGKSSEEGHTRLYFDPELKSYVEIPQEAIQHWQEVSKEVSPLGGYHVWINPSAELIHGKVGPQRTKAKFFEGPIGAAAAGMQAQVTLPSAHPVCPTLFQHCPSFGCAVTQSCPSTACTLSLANCPHTGVPCTEGIFHAQGQAQAQVNLPSAHPVCPTLFQHCPSFGCPVTAGCPSAACTINLVQCGFQPNTVYPCRGFDVAADPRAAQAHAVTIACHQTVLPVCRHTVHPACPPPPTAHNCLTPNIACATMFQHCPSFGCVVTQPCPSTACTLTVENCRQGTGIPCI